MHHLHFGGDGSFERLDRFLPRAISKLEPHLGLLDENRLVAPTPTPELAAEHVALEVGLLQEDDVPPHWTLVSDVASFRLEGLAFCRNARTAFPDPLRSAEQLIAISSFNQDEFISQSVLLYDTEASAAASIEQLRTSVWYTDSCAGRVAGDEVRWRFAPLELESTVDYAAWRAISEYCCPMPEFAEAPYRADRQFDWLAVRRGRLISVLLNVRPSSRNAEILEGELARPRALLLEDLLPNAEQRLADAEAQLGALAD
jgi:hypothetical protein